MKTSSYDEPYEEEIDAEAQYETSEPFVTPITPHYDNVVPSEPPPVPKRTLLPAESSTEVATVSLTNLKYESSVTPLCDASATHLSDNSTVPQYETSSTPQHETFLTPPCESSVFLMCNAPATSRSQHSEPQQSDSSTIPYCETSPQDETSIFLLCSSSSSTPKSHTSATQQYYRSTILQHEIVEEIEETDIQNIGYRDIELVSPGETVLKTDVPNAERWSDSSVSLPGHMEDVEAVTSDTDPGNPQCDPTSEMYYTASSEVSLLSDELQDKVQNDEDDKERDDRKNVIAGHVAAMRERFESMTRTNTPCPDLARSLSPSLEVFRNTSPSPDRMAE